MSLKFICTKIHVFEKKQPISFKYYDFSLSLRSFFIDNLSYLVSTNVSLEIRGTFLVD